MKVADTGFHPRGCHLSALTTWIQEKNGIMQVDTVSPVNKKIIKIAQVIALSIKVQM